MSIDFLELTIDIERRTISLKSPLLPVIPSHKSQYHNINTSFQTFQSLLQTNNPTPAPVLHQWRSVLLKDPDAGEFTLVIVYRGLLSHCKGSSKEVEANYQKAI
jgi:hypothetical protein